MTVSTIELIASVLVLEAGGEPISGMIAVHEVIMRRSVERKLPPESVVTQPLQFSCLNGTTPDAAIAKAKSHPKWDLAIAIAREQADDGLTRGGNHYFSMDIDRVPAWARGKRPTAVIGKHVFLKL